MPMIGAHQSVLTASSASIPTPAPGPGGPLGIALGVCQTDVLMLALGDPALLLGAGKGFPVPRRPVRPRASDGYAPLARPTTSTPKKSTSSTSSAAKSTSSTKSTPSSKSTSGPLGFLNDPKLSVEDKLFKFMCYVADKYDKAIEKKMNEIAGKQNGSTSAGSASSSGGSSSSKKSSGGGLLGGLLGSGGGGGLLGGLVGGGGGGSLLGGLLGGGGGSLGGLVGGLLGGSGGGMLGSLFSAGGVGLDLLKNSGVQDLVTQLSGPVLAGGASVLGFPEFAPLLMQAGPALSKGAFSLLDAVDGGGAGTGGTSGSSSSSTKSSSGGTSSSGSSKSASSSSGTDGEPNIEQKDLMELQQLQNKQQEMFSLVSNMLRSMHDTKMAVINNLRA